MAKIKERIVLVGGGGHAKVIIDAVRGSKDFGIYGIIDPALKIRTSVLGIQVKGPDDILPQIFRNGIKCAFIGIGSVGNCSVRKKIYTMLKGIGFKLPYIVHPKAIVAEGVSIEEGAFVAAGAVINPGVKIGKNVIINTSSSVDHDCAIGDFVHIAPGAILSGGVKVGDEAHIGTGANIIQGITIGKKAFIGAGSIITSDVAKERRVYGQPYQRFKA